jgi:hypothetical protein
MDSELRQNGNSENPKPRAEDNISPVHPRYSRHEQQPAKHRQKQKQLAVAAGEKLLPSQTAVDGNSPQTVHGSFLLSDA